jgi:hypothetical protein
MPSIPSRCRRSIAGSTSFATGEVVGDPFAAANSPEVQDFNVSSIKEWVAAIETSGTADAYAISAAQQVALAQFAPDLVRPE